MRGTTQPSRELSDADLTGSEASPYGRVTIITI
jgi:hypothetical protein